MRPSDVSAARLRRILDTLRRAACSPGCHLYLGDAECFADAAAILETLADVDTEQRAAE